MKKFCVYILRCADDTYYVGMTSGLKLRFKQHIDGFYDDCYTVSRLPVQLVYVENFNDFWSTMRREKQLKKWSRVKKEALIESRLNELPRLAKKNFS